LKEHFGDKQHADGESFQDEVDEAPYCTVNALS